MALQGTSCSLFIVYLQKVIGMGIKLKIFYWFKFHSRCSDEEVYFTQHRLHVCPSLYNCSSWAFFHYFHVLWSLIWIEGMKKNSGCFRLHSKWLILEYTVEIKLICLESDCWQWNITSETVLSYPLLLSIIYPSVLIFFFFFTANHFRK